MMKPTLVLLGAGRVALCLARMLRTSGLSVSAILSTSGICRDQHRIDEWVESGQRPDLWLPFQFSALHHSLLPGIMVDCSAGDFSTTDFEHLLSVGHSLVFCNKSALGHNSCRLYSHPRFAKAVYYEATVAAGLPVIETLRHLCLSGDRIQKIQASLSGTLAWLFYHLRQGQNFSSLLPEALRLGYTEPDPRTDLSLVDVARKARILAQTVGFEPKLVDPSALVPEQYMSLPLNEFMNRLPELDSHFSGMRTKRLAALITSDGIKIEMVEPEADSVWSSLHGSDNLVQIISDFYPEPGLTIQGPGAGIERTASAVFKDVLSAIDSFSTNLKPMRTVKASANSLQVTAYAPASIGNISSGFDVLGLAIEGIGDTVQAEWAAVPGVSIQEITGDGQRLSLDPDKNVIGIVAKYLLQRSNTRMQGVALRLHKGLPLNSGLGSSGASAAAAAAALAALCPDLSQDDLLQACLLAEATVSGRHADNIAASCLGGLVSVNSLEPLEVQKLLQHHSLRVGLIRPQLEVATNEARTVIPMAFDRADVVHNLASVINLVTGMATGDEQMLQRGLSDRLAEPYRRDLIEVFDFLKPLVAQDGYNLCISGSGPSLFILGTNQMAMSKVLQDVKLASSSRGVVCEVSIHGIDRLGARVVSAKS